MIELTDNVVILPFGPPQDINVAVSLAIIERWPKAFGFPPKPLAIGISEHIIECLTPEKSRPAALRPITQQRLAEAVRTFVGAWCNAPIYVQSCKFGEARLGLHGVPLGWVTKDDEEFCAAKFQRAFRKQLATGANDAQMVEWVRNGDCRD
jgi:sRNA-binding protein